MSRKERLSRLSHIFFMPSFYGATTWGGALFLYELRLLDWESNSAYAMAIFMSVEAAFILSVLIVSPLYRNWLVRQTTNKSWKIYPSNSKYMILLLHIIGFIGLGKYVVDFSNNFGGINGFFLTLFNKSHLIRWASKDTLSIGTQISYFGWIAISLTVLQVARKNISRWWLLIALLQFLGNLMYIDRTRPIWIMFTSVLIVLPTIQRLNVGKILKWASVTIIIGLFVFLGIAGWVGKIAEEGAYGTSVLLPSLQTLYAYITAGFPYFNRILETGEAVSYRPERTIYPLLKIFSTFGLIENPPSQVNEMFYLPFETNVGTFLEPFYFDGGILFVILGIFISTFGIDIIGLRLLKSKKPLATYAWTNLCFVSFIGFFTPKIAAFPIWLFCGLGFMSLFTFSRYHTEVKQPYS